MENPILKVAQDEKGASMVEYALLVSLMAILLMAVIGVMRGGASVAFSRVGSATSN